jgi:hypothetical protein
MAANVFSRLILLPLPPSKPNKAGREQTRQLLRAHSAPEGDTGDCQTLAIRLDLLSQTATLAPKFGWTISFHPPVKITHISPCVARAGFILRYLSAQQTELSTLVLNSHDALKSVGPFLSEFYALTNLFSQEVEHETDAYFAPATANFLLSYHRLLNAEWKTYCAIFKASGTSAPVDIDLAARCCQMCCDRVREVVRMLQSVHQNFTSHFRAFLDQLFEYFTALTGFCMGSLFSHQGEHGKAIAYLREGHSKITSFRPLPALSESVGLLKDSLSQSLKEARNDNSLLDNKPVPDGAQPMPPAYPFADTPVEASKEVMALSNAPPAPQKPSPPIRVEPVEEDLVIVPLPIEEMPPTAPRMSASHVPRPPPLDAAERGRGELSATGPARPASGVAVGIPFPDVTPTIL